MANVTINGQSYTGITSVKLLKTGTVDQYEEFKAEAGVDLSALEVYVGDFLNSENYSVTKGSIDGYWNTLIS